ncbi:hypothetical protein Bbelb_005610 [Branchiostoma belcheri]|nr:hypothetical protein Bbelb_005610 [Branchiostoma belcheri]
MRKVSAPVPSLPQLPTHALHTTRQVSAGSGPTGTSIYTTYCQPVKTVYGLDLGLQRTPLPLLLVLVIHQIAACKEHRHPAAAQRTERTSKEQINVRCEESRVEIPSLCSEAASQASPRSPAEHGQLPKL